MKPLVLVPLNQPVVVYGAGNCGVAVARMMAERGYSVLGFLDRQAKTNPLGLPCYSPDDNQAGSWQRQNAALLVGVWNCAVDLSQLESELEQRGWREILLYPEICALWNAPIEPYWVASPQLYDDAEVQAEINAATVLWADEKSKTLFQGALHSRRELDLQPLNLPTAVSDGVQYFPHDLSGWKTPLRLVDCGAYDGDTLRALPDGVEWVAAYEPDGKNFEKLAVVARDAKARCLLWPCGVWSSTTSLDFSGDAGGASRFLPEAVNEAGSWIPVVALDDALAGFAPDMIKMDIEGAEPEALEGARRTIKSHRPALAICVYHQPRHLWQIPLWVSRLDISYRLFLRAHGFNGFDWVLYAVPS